jgi:hypothetical protein
MENLVFPSKYGEIDIIIFSSSSYDILYMCGQI